MAEYERGLADLRWQNNVQKPNPSADDIMQLRLFQAMRLKQQFGEDAYREYMAVKAPILSGPDSTMMTVAKKWGWGAKNDAEIAAAHEEPLFIPPAEIPLLQRIGNSIKTVFGR